MSASAPPPAFEPPASEDVVFALRPTYFPWGRGLIPVWLFSWLLVPFVDELLPEGLGPAVVVASLFVALFGIWLARRLARPEIVAPIAFETNGLHLPVGAWSRRVVKLPYRDILSVSQFGRDELSTVYVSCREHVFAYPLRCFDMPNPKASLRSAIRQRIASLADAPALLKRMAERDDYADRYAARPRVLFRWLLIIILAFVVYQELGPPVLQPLHWGVRFGANQLDLVMQGQVFRWVVANLIHSGFLHPTMNLVALGVVLALLEPVLGWRRLVVVSFISGISAQAVSALIGDNFLARGASGIVFGLWATLAWLNLRSWRQLPGRTRLPIGWWIVVAIMTLQNLLPVNSWVDSFGHAGGLAGGLVGAVLLLGQSAAPYRDVGPTDKTAVAAYACIVITALACVWAVAYSATRSYEDEAVAFEALLQQPKLQADYLNRVAWGYAIDPDAPVEHLQLSLTAAERATTLPCDDCVAAVIDTLATVHYRLDAPEVALDTERRAIELARDSDMPAFLTQMARFAGAAGAPIGRGIDTTDLTLSVEHHGAAPTVRVEIAPERSGRLELLARVRSRQMPVGFFHLVSEVAGDSLSFDVRYLEGLDAVELEVIFVELQASTGEARPPRWWYSAADKQVVALP